MTSIVPTRRLCSAPSSSCGREILISVPGARVSIAENWSFTGNQLVGCSLSSSYIAQCAPSAAAVDRCLAFIRLYVHNCIPIFWRINREFPHAVTTPRAQSIHCRQDCWSSLLFDSMRMMQNVSAPDRGQSVC